MISRFTVLCIVLFAVTTAVQGMYIQSLGDLSAAMGLQCESCEQARPFFAVAAISSAFKLRVFGFVGFVLAAAGNLEFAEKFLALHYGLIGIDDDAAVPAGRLAAGVAGVSLAM
ncbi:hypothetical protein ATCVMN08101_319R [Acanthocystis turfacea Chlorella virus MN0810.1]|nr:hypothetical protein ATCVMN08101_319R [Acanthocystis turfacea Chlorella virus MN0810.1]